MSCENFDFETDKAPTLSEQERIEAIADHYREIIRLIGDDPTREGLVKTPMRAAKAMWFASQGYRQNPDDILRQAIFSSQGSQMVVVRDIEFYSMCEHHILPFFGIVSIGYIPRGSMVGLSKLPRLVNAIARRLQVQERLTAEICAHVAATLDTDGVIVACNARHLCMQMRGVEKQNSVTTTSDFSGAFNQAKTRQEFMNLIHSK